MQQEVLRMEQIGKSYDMMRLFNNLYLNLFKGEVLGLIGLYDSGKTTLLKMIGGELKPDRGRILIYDEDMSGRGTYLHRHVFMVHERTMLVLSLSIAENMFVIRNHRSKKFILHKKSMFSQAQEVLNQLGINLSAQMNVNNLTFAQRHLIELAKAYVVGSKIILIDEIIAAYNEYELQEFQRVIEILKKQGISFIIAGYNTDQISTFADRLVFLANGRSMKVISKKDFGSFDINDLLQKDMGKFIPKVTDRIKGNTVFEIKNLKSHHLEMLSFSIKSGEIVGIFDAGNKAGSKLYRILTGESTDYSGGFLLNGEAFCPKNITRSIKKGIFFMPFQNIGTNTFNNITLIDNICLSVYKKMSSLGYIKKSMLRFIVSEYADNFNIDEKKFKEESCDLDAYTRQKVYLSRIKLAKPAVLFCVNPYAGADAVTQEQLVDFIEQAAQNGTAVCIITANLKSVYDICDSVIMLSDNGQSVKIPKKDIKLHMD